jgi:hypothetical protein
MDAARTDHTLAVVCNVQRRIDEAHALLIDRICGYISEGNTERALKLLRSMQTNLEKSEIEV